MLISFVSASSSLLDPRRPAVSLSLRTASSDLYSGSGLTANRINQFNASGLYPAFNWVSCSPRPALCYRALLALPQSSCLESAHLSLSVARLFLMNALGTLLRVTSLDPRTPHQPEKLQKLSKNNCVLHPVFFWSMEKIDL